MDKVFRVENKYLLTLDEYVLQRFKLEQLMIPDKNNGARGYSVRSLYFDTPYDSDYFEKQAGIETRRKVRLRCYGANNPEAKLELKQKQGAQQLKRSLTVSREDAEKIIKCNYEVLLNYESEFAVEMYGLMKSRVYRPRTVVEYNRMAFIAKENDTRITFDRNVCAISSRFDIFSENLNLMPVMNPMNVVMEIKYNRFLLSYIKDFIRSVHSNETTVSKYCMARQQLYSV